MPPPYEAKPDANEVDTEGYLVAELEVEDEAVQLVNVLFEMV